MLRAAIVVGGGHRVWSDLETALQMCVDADADPEFYVINDMIPLLHDDAMVAVSLHPAKLPWWLGRRASNNLPAPKAVWSQTGHVSAVTTNVLRDWGGSSGLFATQVARDQNHVRVLLCGVPMTTDRHFERKSRWMDCAVFVPAWERHMTELLPFVRSLSGGWTESRLGRPTMEWLCSRES